MAWVPQFGGFLLANQVQKFFAWGFPDDVYSIWMVKPLGAVSEAPFPRMSITSIEVERVHSPGTGTTSTLTYYLTLHNVGSVNTVFQVYYNDIN